RFSTELFAITTVSFSIAAPASSRAPHSFPTRRSSDLYQNRHSEGGDAHPNLLHRGFDPFYRFGGGAPAPARGGWSAGTRRISTRSEEHTSELQSRENLVCRLLLEKKNTTNDITLQQHP